ncbi:sugar transferase [Arthrobacter tecti]
MRISDSIIVLATVLVSSGVSLQLSADQLLVIGSTGSQAIGIASGVLVAWLLMLCLFRTRDPRVFGLGALEYKRVVQASAATFGWLAVVVVVIGTEGLGGYLLITLPAGVIGLVGSRWVWRRWLGHQRERGFYLSRVLVVGKRSDVQYVISQLRKAGPAYEVVGAVLEGKKKALTQMVQVGQRLVPTVAGLCNVETAVKEYCADAVIVAGHLHKGGRYIRELGWRLERTSTELVLASSLTNVAGPRIQMRPVDGLPLMHVELPQFTGGKHVLKRSIDVLASSVALMLLSPLFLLLASIIRHDSDGPVFFHQDRIGREGTRFTMFKFRSMVMSAEAELEQLRNSNEANGLLFKMREDPRITRVGRWLRKYSLDELPQLYNVLRGDMSLVGPRPPLPVEVSGYEGHIHRRLFIKPGLTGLWQVSGRSDLDWDESVRLDLYYVENWSVTGDLMIMWRTLKVLLKPVGAY